MKNLLTAIAPVLVWDEKIFRFINSHHSALFDAFFWGCSTFGSAWGIVPAYALFILFASKKSRVWVVFIASAVTLLAGAYLTDTIKDGLNRPRPLAYFDKVNTRAANGEAVQPYRVHNVGPALTENSFPSGHSWVSFEIATLLVLFFGRKYWWAYLVAAAIAYSRMYSGVHFPVDVLGGALCGTLLAFLVWRVTAWIAPERARPPK